MNTPAVVALVAIALVGVVSAVIGSIGVRVARSTSDFLVASRTVGPVANATAISGEYLSVASFLGIAGLILRKARTRCGCRSRSPRATWRSCCSSRHRCAGPAPTPCPISPRPG